MTKLLTEALEVVRELPDDMQDEIAALMLHAVERDLNPYGLSPEQLAELDEAIADEDDATDDEVAAFFARFRG